MNESTHPVLDIGPDETRVSGFTTSTHEARARIFLPVLGPRDRPLTWSHLAELAGARLDAGLRWSTLTAQLEPELVAELEPAYGRPQPEVTAAITELLTTATTSPDDANVALWEGHQDDIAGLKLDDFPPEVKAPSKPHGGHLLHRASLSWLADYTRGEPLGRRLPVFVWPVDAAFRLACPIYHDSAYISGSRRLLHQLAGAGLEVFEIDRDTALPSDSRCR
jgi:hypothetical protein